MIEMLIVAAIWTVVVKRGVEDILHTARGGTPHRYAAAKARRESGAAGRYWSALWSDTFDDMLAKHTERRARRQASPSTPRPRGAASQFFAGLFQDASRSARRSWRDGWTVLDERRREKATRPRPGQVTVPGTVVPNAQDEDRPQDGDEDGDRPGPEPRLVPDGDGRTDLRFGEDEDDPTGVSSCPECDGSGINKDGGICESCRDRQEQRNQHYEDQPAPDSGPESGPDQDISPIAGPTTQEGPTMTTMPSTEIVGLEPAITFFEASAQAYTEQSVRIGDTLAALQGFELSGPALADAASAMDMSQSCAASSSRVAAELKKHRPIAEAIDAVDGAANKIDFYRAGR